jgi:DNA-binding transcriptional MerR regulator
VYTIAVSDATPDSDQMTIEELAHASGVAFTTIRLYQHRGLLPPPEKKGRVGYYDASHLARLQLIGELSERGFSLAAINELVDDWQRGRSLGDVLGLESDVATLLQPPPTMRLTPAELMERLSGLAMTGEVMQRAIVLGLVKADGTDFVVDPTFLEVGSTLIGMGIPAGALLDEYEHLTEVTEALAGRFTALFDDHLWQPFVEAGMPEDRFGPLSDDLARLAPLAETITTVLLRRALATEASRFLAEKAQGWTPQSPSAGGADADGEATS